MAPINLSLWKMRARQLQRYYHCEDKDIDTSLRTLIKDEDLDRAALLSGDFMWKVDKAEEDWPGNWSMTPKSLQSFLSRKDWRAFPVKNKTIPPSLASQEQEQDDDGVSDADPLDDGDGDGFGGIGLPEVGFSTQDVRKFQRFLARKQKERELERRR